MTYLITFACYGLHLHGNEIGSVDREHSLYGSRLLAIDAERVSAERELMDQPSYALDKDRRAAVLRALQEVCSHRGWSLLAAHVRSTHVHAVVEADARPEKVMNGLKSYASRGLNRLCVDDTSRKRWARHGSTRWLWNRKEVSAAIRYVIEGQGDPMAVFGEAR
jgi:REP element-mobilizing transposase RayT